MLQLLCAHVSILKEHEDILLTGRVCLSVVQLDLLCTRGMPGAVAVTVRLKLGVAAQHGTLHPAKVWHSVMQEEQG